jgi:pSer/pThr/pTyr-binding forkhead associated (FHA) protein
VKSLSIERDVDVKAMKLQLESVDPWVTKLRIAVDRLPASIGRDADADIQIPDRWVSRVHCELFELDGALAVRDLVSANGTFVNGIRIEEIALAPGDELLLGMTRLQVKYKRRPSRFSGSRSAKAS